MKFCGSAWAACWTTLGNADEAIEAYKKALAVKADYFDANYNLGALYFNQAVQGIERSQRHVEATHDQNRIC